MNQPIKLGTIPDKEYADYRYDVIFKAYKWDPQVGDHNTIAKHVVLMTSQMAVQLETWAEELSKETILMEETLAKKPSLAKELGFPKEVNKALGRLSNYDRSQNVRLMRFDFHPTTTGWAVSEVNSDVPGGLAEASVLPVIASQYFEGFTTRNHVAKALLEAFRSKTKQGGTVAFVHATSYSDDRQVMQFLGDHFDEKGYHTLYVAPDHIKWVGKRAVSTIKGQEGNLEGIIRFFPLEWLTNLPRGSNWMGYYDCETPSCNHPVAIFAQSKRLPLIWDELGVDIPAWKALLPPTRDPRTIELQNGDWILKPALGRVGEGISIKGAVSEKERRSIEKAAKKQPVNWVAQQMFHSQPLTTENRESYHLCVGVFTVDGKCAGFYGRISLNPRIDANAKDIPVLVFKEAMGNEG